MSFANIDALQILLVAYAPLAAVAYWGLPQIILQVYSAHPWLPLLANFALPILALVYTGPKSQIRLAVFPVTAVTSSCYHAISPYFMPDRAMASLCDGIHMLSYLTAIDALLLRSLYLDKTGTERSEVKDREKRVNGQASWTQDRRTDPDLPTWNRLAWAAHILFSYRAIGTSREAKNTPRFSGRHVPSRAKFLLYRGCAVVGAFVFVDFTNHLLPPSQETFAAHKSKLLLSKSDMTMETITIRVISTVMFWIALRASIGFIYNLSSFIGVATLFTAPVDWPPYFGSPRKAYTLRNYWA